MGMGVLKRKSHVLVQKLFFFFLVLPSTTTENLLQAPRFTTSSSSSKIIRLGTTKIVQCQAFGNPSPQFRWMKDGVKITELSTDPTYKIISAKLDDGGSYRCIAANKIGSILSEEIKIIVAYMGVFEDQAEQTVLVKEGDAAIIDLPEIDSTPSPEVTWQTDEGITPYGPKYALSTNKQLIILSTEPSDQKAYRARAINSQEGKEENSAYIRLIVEQTYDNKEIAPEIIVGPKDLEIIKGTPQTSIDCIANARPLYELETLWFKDGIPIESTGVQYSFNDIWNRTLILTSVNTTYSGQYECQVNLKSGGFPTAIASAQIDVLEKPTFLNSAKPETLGEYFSSISLPCDVLGIPKPSVTWYKNSEKVNLTERKYEVQEDNSLLIQKLVLHDSGMYQCFAVNEAGEGSLSSWLKVKTSKPVMEVGPQNTTIFEGLDAKLNCQAAGAPIPKTTWVHNGQSEVAVSDKTQILENGDLLIVDVQVTDSGEYTCIRSNEMGEVKQTAYLQVTVRTQIVQPPMDSRVLMGQTATLQCTVSSDPTVPYQLDWFLGGIKVISSTAGRIHIFNNGTLYIDAVRASEAGNYTCSVQSPGGNETRSATLLIIELPYPPSNVRASRFDKGVQRAVNVSWTPDFDGNSPIQKYIVQIREIPEFVPPIAGPIPDPLNNWVTEISNISANSRSILLTHLKAATMYQFRVIAVNGVGEGLPSAPSNEVMLPQEAPSGPPVGFVGSARSKSEIITQWQPPLEEHRNGQILGYIIRYKLYGYNKTPWTTRNITNEAQRNYLITDLITWKDYVIQIAAYNNKGVGVYTESAKIKTKEGVPEAPPMIKKIEALNSTSIQIWWTPPDPQRINGINLGYKIQAWQWHPTKGDKEMNIIIVTPNLLDPYAEQTAVMTHLNKFQDYNISVLCFTDPGNGRRSEKYPVKTLEDVPDEVSNIHFEDVSDRAVKVLWQPPKNINGILTGYQLTYQIKDKPRTIRVKNLTADTLSFNVKDLQASTHYRFEVKASTVVGLGPSRPAIIQSGVKPVLPHPPTKLALSNIEAFSVVLQFTPGFDGNSSIIKWTVEAQTNRNTSWFVVYEISDPDATSIFVAGLVPFTAYKLRLIANNVVGASTPSEATKGFQTIQAPPAMPPRNVSIRAMNATGIRVRWIPLQQSEWYGNPKGYNITYTEIRTGISRSCSIEDHNANSHIITNLEEFSLYQVKMQSCNEVGCSPTGLTAVEKTKESVPGAGPMNVVANATSSTTIVVKWDNVSIQHQNGVIEGYKVFYAAENKSPVQYKLIPKNTTYTTTLTELKKYVEYHIQVKAYTRSGDGKPSQPALRIRTFEDTPGAPSNVSFPDVNVDSVRIIWDVPEDPNGEILGYEVLYQLNEENVYNKSKREFKATERTFTIYHLLSKKYYLFSVMARTELGWGEKAYALVYTTNHREIPQAPSKPQISGSQVQSQQITFTWTPGRDGFAPLRYYIIQKMEESNPWQSLPKRVDPQLTSYTILDLKPFTKYKFRIQAINDIGPSQFSLESEEVRTLPAAPSVGVHNVKVIPITTNKVNVSWEPVHEQYWSGDVKTGGYKIVYQPVGDFSTALQDAPTETLKGIGKNLTQLAGLMQDVNYEIIVIPFNAQGPGPESAPVTVYVGEAVPTGPPRDFNGEPIASTEIIVRWKPPEENMQNGELSGYKIFYKNLIQELAEAKKYEEEIEVVPASEISYTLCCLEKFTLYSIQVLAFNPAGDGPRTKSVTIKTFQDEPSAPVNLTFSDITMNSLTVSWDPPEQENGDIISYIVAYHTTEESERFSKQVKQQVTTTYLRIQGLEEQITYTFRVKAETIKYGPDIARNVTTGPQEGSPSTPKQLQLSKTLSSIEMRWINGATGKGPILGYYIESRKQDETRWQLVTKTTNGPLQDFMVLYQSLLPSTLYKFRVISYNKFGISFPAYSDELILTPSKLYMEYGYLQLAPFYRQTWFMVALAAISIIIIITIIAILCVKSKSYKYKQEAQKTLEESIAMSTGDPQDLSLDFYRSRNSSSSHSLAHVNKRGTLSRKQAVHHPPPIVVVKSPPRPSPASVPYNSDEESLKGYDENPDDSSVTEKPSEASSSDSQGSESENESVRSDPHSFVNHYANVNDTLRQSWKRQKPVRNYSSYTDSEPEGSTVVSLNGGQIIMNNMARSRAPLPGFSSFV